MDAGRPRFEVADVVRECGDDYRRAHRPSAAQDKVLRHVADCRTAALGGHVDRCDACGRRRVSYNSCRDRHCPKCQGIARGDWLELRLERLLPVPYFHVVFTIPDDLNPIALGNKRLVFDLLFQAAAETLKAIARDKKHLGARVGFTAVLHTWGQNLGFHPHLHVVVTGGGLSPDGERWIAGRDGYFLPVKVLARLFRGKFLAGLKKARAEEKLRFDAGAAELVGDAEWKRFIDGLHRKEWIVYAKPPFGGPEQVFGYLGRYTHRVAISNHRIVDFEGGKVAFIVKDYKDGGKMKRMTLDAVEFLRRFLLHVLPKGFSRIRHYGLLAGGNVATRLERARVLLEGEKTKTPVPIVAPDAPWWERLLARTGIDLMACPRCGGRLIRTFEVARSPGGWAPTGADPVPPDAPLALDTS